MSWPVMTGHDMSWPVMTCQLSSSLGKYQPSQIRFFFQNYVKLFNVTVIRNEVVDLAFFGFSSASGHVMTCNDKSRHVWEVRSRFGALWRLLKALWKLAIFGSIQRNPLLERFKTFWSFFLEASDAFWNLFKPFETFSCRRFAGDSFEPFLILIYICIYICVYRCVYIYMYIF